MESWGTRARLSKLSDFRQCLYQRRRSTRAMTKPQILSSSSKTPRPVTETRGDEVVSGEPTDGPLVGVFWTGVAGSVGCTSTGVSWVGMVFDVGCESGGVGAGVCLAVPPAAD